MIKLVINMESCISCDVCIDICAKMKAISKTDDGIYTINNDKCEECGACQKMCMGMAIVEA